MLEKTCLAIAAEDKAGRRWAKQHGYRGYTSYASLNDLITRASIFAELERDIARHVAAFAVREAEFDLGRRKLVLDSLWTNVMKRGAVHAPHIHPHSVVSGTFAIMSTAPQGSGGIRFEDPRAGNADGRAAKKKNASPENQTFVDRHTPARDAASYGKAGCAMALKPMRRQGPAHQHQLQLQGLDAGSCADLRRYNHASTVHGRNRHESVQRIAGNTVTLVEHRAGAGAAVHRHQPGDQRPGRCL